MGQKQEPSSIIQLEEYRKAIERYIAARKEYLSGTSEVERTSLDRGHLWIIPDLPFVPDDCLPLYLASAIVGYILVGITPDTRIVWFSLGAVPPFRGHKLISTFASLADFFAERLKNIDLLDTIRVYRAITKELLSAYPDIAPLLPDAPEISPEITDEENWNLAHS